MGFNVVPARGQDTYVAIPSQAPTTFTRLVSASLLADAATLTATFTSRRYLWIQIFSEGKTLAEGLRGRFNADAAANYSSRGSTNNAADVTTVTQTEFFIAANTTANEFVNMFIYNQADRVKRVIYWANLISVIAATAPTRSDSTAIWVNTADQITSFTLLTSAGTTLLAGTRIEVYGCD